MQSPETLRLAELDVFFLSYDEPNAEANWLIAKKLIPTIKRVHGVDGFDAAYKLCALMSTTPYFVTIDADNEVRWQFKYTEVEIVDGVGAYSWGAMNNVNSLVYGNGGIKCWHREKALTMSTHEEGGTGGEVIDFFWAVQYQKCPEILSDVIVNSSPYHAFRAGFREGAKMLLEEGEKQPIEEIWLRIEQQRITMNMKRLAVWCSMGTDKPHGIWAMLGARLGCLYAFEPDFNLEKISDYYWFQNFWRQPLCMPRSHDMLPPIKEWSEAQLLTAIDQLGEEMYASLGIPVVQLNDQQSDFFNFTIVHPERRGLQ